MMKRPLFLPEASLSPLTRVISHQINKPCSEIELSEGKLVTGMEEKQQGVMSLEPNTDIQHSDLSQVKSGWKTTSSHLTIICEN